MRLSVTRIDLKDPGTPGQLLLELDEESSAAAVTRATAWAQVRGYDRLSTAIEELLGGEPPESGFAAVINKPHSLLLLATWPWRPNRQRRT